MMTNQKIYFLVRQDPGMKGWDLHQAAGSSQHVPHSCGGEGHTTALFPNFNRGLRTEQWDKDNYVPEETLTSGALKGLQLRPASSPVSVVS